MLKHLPGPLRAILSLLFGVLNTLFWFGWIVLVAVPKLLIPFRAWRTFCSGILNRLAGHWIALNNWGLAVTKSIQWDVSGLEGLDPKAWYLVISNHQAWSDIVILQKIFHGRTPFLKFFIKKELIWVPLLGLAWWALDFPFMKRYSREAIEKKPRLRGKDLATTMKACEKFKTLPVAVMNFVEGTRFTTARHQQQQSPYRHLLRPKAGGVASILQAMGDQLTAIVNVTIVYPQGAKSFWHFLCQKAVEIKVRIETVPVSRELVGDYFGDTEYRQRIQQWLNQLWQEKDRQIDHLLET